jgi:LacI family transcriptional regulator
LNIEEKQAVRQRRPTIKDVAAVAGVSITTVSNVLNDRVHAMSPETLERIQRAIQVLDYRPSRVARGLAMRDSATICVVVAEFETALFLQALQVIEPTARAAGYTTLMISARSLEDERQAIDVLVEKEVNGVIFLSTSVYTDTLHIARFHEAGVPVVLVNRPSTDILFDHIDWDDAGAAEALVKHLVDLGHRRIAHLRGPGTRRSAVERLSGYTRALEACGLTYRPEYTPSGDFTSTSETWQQSTLDLLALPEPPTAIIASDDTVAATIMKVVQRNRRRVPEDIALVGVDDQPFSAHLNPALTTARLPIVEAGQHAIDLVLQRISGNSSPPVRMMLPCPLVIRESSGASLVPVP